MSLELVPVETDREPVSLAEQAYRKLRDRLIMLDIRPGDPINDGQLAAELGVGRTPVREALRRLETDHLVVSYPRRGTFATIVDITELAAISELRQLLEPLAARKAARNAGRVLRQELEAVARTIEELGRSGEMPEKKMLMRYDITAHRLIYRAAGNA